MAKHIVHKHSAIKNKTPVPNQLEYGEIAINYNAESPQIYIKDSNDNINVLARTAIKSRGISEEEMYRLLYRSLLLGNMDLSFEQEMFNKILKEWMVL